jgi:hypothetical protein
MASGTKTRQGRSTKNLSGSKGSSGGSKRNATGDQGAKRGAAAAGKKAR